MSGRHRVVQPRRRLTPVASTTRVARSLTRLFRGSAKKVLRRSWTRLVERARDRFEWEDPFAGVHLDPQATSDPQDTSPDPILAPAPPAEPEPAPLALTPEQVLPVLHRQHPHLPVAHVLWHVTDMGVSGEVNALEADDTGRRRIVGMFAAALGVPVAEEPDGEHLTVYAVGEVGGVPVTVAAVLVHADAVLLPVFEEAAADPTLGDDTLSTQHIPERMLAEVVGA